MPNLKQRLARLEAEIQSKQPGKLCADILDAGYQSLRDDLDLIEITIEGHKFTRYAFLEGQRRAEAFEADVLEAARQDAARHKAEILVGGGDPNEPE